MKTPNQNQVPADDPRSGVALIMVLGMLVILIVLAGAFVVTMRTERVAARNSADGVRTRMLMPVAIRQAVDHHLSAGFFSEGSVCGIANEGTTLTLTAPAGTVITSIEFASYGNPSGTCADGFSYGWCHAVDSLSIVEGLALGRNWVQIGANNTTFGDPCGGTGKKLAVRASYSSQFGQVYAANNVMVPSSDDPASGYYDVTNMYTDAAEQYIPYDLRSAVETAVTSGGPADWVTLLGADGKARGRFTFVAADCSGFLDANNAIGDQNREQGKTPKEMNLADLHDVDSLAGQVKLFDILYDPSDPDYIGRFENYKELIDHDGGGFISGFSRPRDFFTYSRYPSWYVFGQTVRIFNPADASNQDMIQLAEVEVFSDGVNVAPGGTATHSSQCCGGVPSRAIDGNTNQQWGGGSVTHTGGNTFPGEWWQVDLGGEFKIDTIVLYNRADCCGFRLRNYMVEIYDSGGNLVWSQGPNPSPDQPPYRAVFPVTPVLLDGDVTAPGRETEIKETLSSLFAFEPNPDAIADVAYANLLDYADTNKVPRDFIIGTTESVPMYNEFWQETIVDNINVADTNIEFLVTVDAELFYPFVTADSTTYEANIASVTATITVEDDVGNAATGSVSVTTFVGADRPYTVGEYYSEEILNDSVIVELDSTVPPVQLSNSTVKVEISLAGAEVHAGAAVVDQLADGIVIVTNTAPAAVSAGVDIDGGAECLDPRFNYDITDATATYWTITDASSLGDTNAWTASVLDPAVNDGDTAMYVKDSLLDVVGELGYLALAPWQTIKLYNNGNGLYDPVHDYFTMDTNLVAYGLVNPNSAKVNPTTGDYEVLAAVFNDMPIDLFPGDPTAQYLTWAEAVSIADDIVPQQNFTKVSDVVAFAGNYVQASTHSGIVNELQRESLLRNAAEIMGIRNNVVTMLLLLQVGEDVDASRFIEDDEVNGTEKAAVVLWRDGHPGGKYAPFFVRQIHRLY